MTEPLTILISTYLEPELVAEIAAASPGDTVLYQPELMPAPRYVSDHGGVAPELDDAAVERWLGMLRQADVAFDFDWRDPAALPTTAPRLKWVQATSAGIGGFMARTGLDRSGITATTAGGVHAVPLAEFALTGALHFVKGVPHLRSQQAAHRWERYTTRQLAGLNVTVVGVGGMGSNVVAVFDALGAHVTAVGRPGGSYSLAPSVRVADTDGLHDVLPGTDVLVLCTALTAATDGLIGPDELALLPRDAVLVNISRGQVVDEEALIEALTEGRLLGAALDVVAHEPLPADSPLWDLDNVLLSPHSASTVASENRTLTELFNENLRRFRAGEPLKNLYDSERGY